MSRYPPQECFAQQNTAHSPLERAFFMLGESQTPSPLSRFRVTLGPLAGILYLLTNFSSKNSFNMGSYGSVCSATDLKR